MKCPYCMGNMEKGIVQSPYEIRWLKGTKKRLFSRECCDDDSVVVAESSFLNGSAVTSFLCRICRKIVIDLPEEK